MPIFTTLVKFTSQEVTNLDYTRAAIKGSSKMATELGIQAISAYAMRGPFDMMLIYEAANQKVSAMLSENFTSKWGNGISVTWTLIPEKELAKIPGKNRGLA